MAQYGRPILDITTTNWTIVGASVHYDAIDETSADDATTYIYSPNETSATYECKLSSITDPVVHTGHIVRVRGCKVNNGTPTPTKGPPLTQFYLYQGTTMIASLTDQAYWPWRDYTFTLSTTQAGNISDYSNLRVRVVVTTNGAGDGGFAISKIEMETPDAPVTESPYSQVIII